GEWLVEKKYEASPEALRLLLQAVQNVETRSPVPVNGIENVVRDMLKERQRIEIYTGDEKPAKAYYIGGPTLDGIGTYMLMDLGEKTAKKPYITYIPSVRAYLTGRYDAKLLHWRSVWIYRQNRETIKDVKITYHNVDSLQSFSIEKEVNDSFKFYNYKHELATPQPKQLLLAQYLDFYSELSIEAFKNDDEGKDSILKNGTFCTISLTDVKGKNKTVELYRAPVTSASMVRTAPDGRPLKYDIEKFYLLFNNKEDFALAQYYVWAKTLRGYDEFLQHNAKPILNNNK
ncbi:MAG TPA: hypothetical protein VGB95_02145, partial [Chitinophagales bacterium]